MQQDQFQIGDPQEAFKAPNAGAKFRLGNETEAYLETTFDYGMRPEEDAKAFFDTRITVSYVTPTSNTNSFETTIALREAFVLAKGVLGGQESAGFWAGQRFYDRHDLHMSDFWYRDLSGFGGGVEGVRLGENVRLAFAWLGGSLNELDSDGTPPPPGSFQLSKNTFDLRLYQLPLLGGRLQLAADVAFFNGDTLRSPVGELVVRDDTGWAVAATHEQGLGGHPKEQLVADFGLTPDNVERVVARLKSRGLIADVRGDINGYVPGRPAGTIRLDEVLSIFRSSDIEIAHGATSPALAELVGELDETRKRRIAGITIADLMPQPPIQDESAPIPIGTRKQPD